MKTLIIFSGGLDSATLAYKIAKEQTLSLLVSFDYGQRHKKELDFAAAFAKEMGVEHQIVDISAAGALLSGSALTDNIDVPEGHYAEETMKATVVPNRNAIMLAIAYGIASARNLDAVATAVHGGDHFIYPDCRPGFIHAFETMQNHALEGMNAITLITPFLNQDKTLIAAEAGRLGLPIEKTWSCYKGGDIHCGKCGTCVERREALELAGVEDPTPYEDRDYWITATQDHAKETARG